MRRRIVLLVALTATACSALVDLGPLRGEGGASDAADESDAPLAHATSCEGVAPCDEPEVCCAICHSDAASGCTFTFSCTPSANDCSGVPFACSDPSSCSDGDVCCEQIGQGGGFIVQTSCTTRAECDASAPSRLLCDPNASDPCPYGGQCLLSQAADYANVFECR